MFLTFTKLLSHLLTRLRNGAKISELAEAPQSYDESKIITGTPIEKLTHLTKHPGTITGCPEDLVHLNWFNEP